MYVYVLLNSNSVLCFVTCYLCECLADMQIRFVSYCISDVCVCMYMYMYVFVCECVSVCLTCMCVFVCVW